MQLAQELYKNTLTKRQLSIEQAIELIQESGENPSFLAKLKKYSFSAPRDIRYLVPDSRLTNKGMPIELAFVWPSNQFRFTSDVFPGALPFERMLKSLEICREIEKEEHEHMLNEILAACIKSGEDFRYGAWLGFKNNQSKPKLYAEVGPGVEWTTWQKQEIIHTYFHHRNLKLVMVGIQPEEGSIEFYYRIKFLYPADIKVLLDFFKLPDLSEEVVFMLESLLKRRIKAEIPTTDIGFSVSYASSGKVQAFTLYSYAQSLLGMDHQIRKSILSLAEEMNWEVGLYKRLSEALHREFFDINTWHGMVGFVVGQKDPVQFTVGLAPVEDYEAPEFSI